MYTVMMPKYNKWLFKESLSNKTSFTQGTLKHLTHNLNEIWKYHHGLNLLIIAAETDMGIILG